MINKQLKIKTQYLFLHIIYCKGLHRISPLLNFFVIPILGKYLPLAKMTASNSNSIKVVEWK
jgi:hypothetical protein